LITAHVTDIVEEKQIEPVELMKFLRQAQITAWCLKAFEPDQCIA
jgi:hypothetical protein